MSKTYRDYYLHKAKWSRYREVTLKQFLAAWDSFPYRYQQSYSKNPMWWNHLYSIEKHRRIQRDCIQKLKHSIDWFEELNWPTFKKPTVYYW